MRSKFLIPLYSLSLLASSMVMAQSYDSTGSARLFVTPQASQVETNVPGYGSFSEGAVVKRFHISWGGGGGAQCGQTVERGLCVVRKGQNGSLIGSLYFGQANYQYIDLDEWRGSTRPGNAPACPVNTIGEVVAVSGGFQSCN